MTGIPQPLKEDRFDLKSDRLLKTLTNAGIVLASASSIVSVSACFLWFNQVARTAPANSNLVQLIGMNSGSSIALLFFFIVALSLLAIGVSRWAKKFIAPIRRESKIIRQFTQDSGHELATPVAAIQSQLQLMERELELGGDYAKHMPEVLESAKVLAKLVDDLRFLSRSENPYLEHQLTIIPVDKFVKSLIASKTADFEQAGISLSAARLDPVILLIDREGLERAISNLLSNAMRYGKPGGTTTISVIAEDKSARIVIRDDGSGIAEPDLPHLFERFYSADRSRSEKFKGSGLGLSIVKAVVDAHGGSISVKSVKGEGTEFSIVLPTTPDQHPLAKLAEWSRMS